MPKAYAFTRYGGPETEEFLDLPVPVPGPGQLLVAVRAAGVNPVDHKLRGGYRRPGSPPGELPEVLGSEVSGVVRRVGPDVDGFAVGDAVFGNPVTGGYAQYTLLPARIAAHKPDELSFTDAAALSVAAATAYDGLRQLGLPAGATLVVLGAGGGVGAAVLQLARHYGLRSFGVSSPAKQAFVESFGAVHVASGPGFEDRVGAVAPDGADAVFDLVGGDTLTAGATLLFDRTKLITGADKQAVVALGGAPVARARTADVLTELARLAVLGVLDPQVSRTYPFAEAGEALRAVESGHALGKTVIEVDAAEGDA